MGFANTGRHRSMSRKRGTGEETLLLPMAFTPGSPVHPAYGAGHASVAGVCVTVLKAYFKTFDVQADGTVVPLKLSTLTEKADPYGAAAPFKAYVTGTNAMGRGIRVPLGASEASPSDD